MILFYKNSFLASVVSVLGCVFVMVAIVEFEYLDMETIVPCVLAGVALMIWGKVISNNKAFKTWWKELEKKGVIAQLPNDTNLAIKVYQANPKSKTLNKIRELNPVAAQTIEQNIVKK